MPTTPHAYVVRHETCSGHAGQRTSHGPGDAAASVARGVWWRKRLEQCARGARRLGAERATKRRESFRSRGRSLSSAGGRARKRPRDGDAAPARGRRPRARAQGRDGRPGGPARREGARGRRARRETGQGARAMVRLLTRVAVPYDRIARPEDAEDASARAPAYNRRIYVFIRIYYVRVRLIRLRVRFRARQTCRCFSDPRDSSLKKRAVGAEVTSNAQRARSIHDFGTADPEVPRYFRGYPR